MQAWVHSHELFSSCWRSTNRRARAGAGPGLCELTPGPCGLRIAATVPCPAGGDDERRRLQRRLAAVGREHGSDRGPRRGHRRLPSGASSTGAATSCSPSPLPWSLSLASCPRGPRRPARRAERGERFVRVSAAADAEAVRALPDRCLGPLQAGVFTFSRDWMREMFADLQGLRAEGFHVGLTFKLPAQCVLQRVWLGGSRCCPSWRWGRRCARSCRGRCPTPSAEERLHNVCPQG